MTLLTDTHTTRCNYTLVLALGFAALALWAAEAHATATWNVGGEADWNVAGNWSPVGVPNDADNVYINNGGTAKIVSASAASNNVYLGQASGESGSIKLYAGYTLYCDHNIRVGVAGTGTVYHYGGNVSAYYTTGDLYLGDDNTGVGTYYFSSGNIYMYHQYIGYDGTGYFYHSGGVNYVGASGVSRDLMIGDAGSAHAGTGTYRLSGTGDLRLPDNTAKIYVGVDSSYIGTGRFEWFRSGGISRTGGADKPTMYFGTNGTLAMGYNFDAEDLMSGIYVPLSGLNNATLEVTNGATCTKNDNVTTGVKYLRIGSAAGSGAGQLSLGTFSTGQDEYIGDGGTGTMNQSGGANSVTTHLFIGRNVGGNGTYNLSAGSLTVGSHVHVGCGATGAVVHSGGSHSFGANTLYVGQAEGGRNGNGRYQLSGTGTLVGGAVSIGADGSAGRFEWFRNGGIDLSANMAMGATGTLAMGADFDLSNLFSGGIYTGTPPTGLNTGTLEVTRSAVAYQNSGTYTLGTLRLGSSDGSGTFRMGGTRLNISTALRIGADSGNGRFEWYADSGVVSSPNMIFGSGGTLAMGKNFSVATLADGTLYSGSPPQNLSQAALEITDSAAATQNGSALQVAALRLGGADGPGTYNLQGGTLSAATLLIANAAAGTLNVSGGTLSAGSLTLGLSGASPPSGTLSITNAAAALTLSGNLLFNPSARLTNVAADSRITLTGSNVENLSTTPNNLSGLINLTLSFEQPAGSPVLDKFEVACRDLGATLDGYLGNFALDVLSLGAANGSRSAWVQLADAFDNQSGREALYVHDLYVYPNTTLDLNGLNLYYDGTLVAQGQIVGGTPTPIPEPSTWLLAAAGAGLIIALRRRAR